MPKFKQILITVYSLPKLIHCFIVYVKKSKMAEWAKMSKDHKIQNKKLRNKTGRQ